MKYDTYLISDLIDEISMGPFGSNIKVECFVDDGIPVLNGSNLDGFELSENSFRYVTEEKADSLKKANAHKGDIVITHRGTLGQIVYIPQTAKYDRYVISQSQFRIRCNEKVLPEYLVYYFHTPIGQHKLLSNASQVGVPALARPSSTFQQIEVELPDIETQKKVVRLINSFQQLIKLNKKLNANLEEQAQALFKHWFVDFEFPNEEGKPYRSSGGKMVESEMGLIPEGWDCSSVSNFLIINPKLSLKKGDTATYVDMGSLPTDNGSIYERSKKVFSGGMKFQNGDVLFARITPCLENGKTAFVDFLNDDEVGFGSTEFIVLRGKGEVKFPYVYSLARSDEFRKHCIASMVGSSGRQRVQNSCFNDYLVAVAPHTILKKYNNICLRLFELISCNTRENIILSEIRDTLLPKLMSGEISLAEHKAKIETFEA